MPAVSRSRPRLPVVDAGHVPSAAELVAVGRAAGLDAVGVAPAAPFLTTRRHLARRKAAGLHGGMAFTYRRPERSTDPGQVVPGARALVVGARAYLRSDPADPADPPGAADEAVTDGGSGAERLRSSALGGEGHEAGPPGTAGGAVPYGGGGGRPVGRVARYAWQDHYAALRESLSAIAARLTEHGWRARVVADDNALVDREAAYRAGLGWYGKNANLLLPGAGSWFVLGSVVTDAPIAMPDAGTASGGRVADGCGTCRRCLDGCPTQAIVAPGVVDARRCLAWLLQAEGRFPPEHRVALGDRIYGCDDCQEVCPPNRRLTRRREPAAAAADAEPVVDLLDLLAADDAALLDRHGRWYVPRREARYLRRNALIALGNVADPGRSDVAAGLGRALSDPDPIVRGHAVWAARRLGRDDLAAPLAGDTDPLVRAELAAPVPARADLHRPA